MKEIIVAIIGLLGIALSTVGVMLAKYWLDKRRRAWGEHKNILADIARLNLIHREIDDIMSSTRTDRFLILRAENGMTDPKYATAVYVQHRNHPVPTYFRLKVDDEYRKMLRDAESQGLVRLKVDAMPDSLLKNIYMGEGVKYSNCYFIARRDAEDGKSVLTYCTLATHEDQPFTNAEEMKQLIFVSKLRAVVFHPETAISEIAPPEP